MITEVLENLWLAWLVLKPLAVASALAPAPATPVLAPALLPPPAPIPALTPAPPIWALLLVPKPLLAGSGSDSKPAVNRQPGFRREDS